MGKTALKCSKTRPPARASQITSIQVKLQQKQYVSHDVRRFRFSLTDANSILGLPLGKPINLKARINGKTVIRSYTPISVDEEAIGYFDLMVKIYPEGKMGGWLDEMEIGEEVAVSGPVGGIYFDGGCFKARAHEVLKGDVKKVGMVAAGSGITPMLQLIRSLSSSIQFSLVYSNKTYDDILCKTELNQLSYTVSTSMTHTLSTANPLSVHYTISKRKQTRSGPTRKYFLFPCECTN